MEAPPTTISSLPPELLSHVFSFLDQTTLASAALASPSFARQATLRLFHAPIVTSLKSFTMLLEILQADRLVRGFGALRVGGDEEPIARTTTPDPYASDEEEVEEAEAEEVWVEPPWSEQVAVVKIICRDVGIRGWGSRLGHLMMLCPNIRDLYVYGVEDLRIKALSSNGSLRTLYLATTSIRPHSLPTSPHLAQTLSSLRTLTLHNLGLPAPSTHVSHLLSHSPLLSTLSLSFLRDLSPSLFAASFAEVPSSLSHLQLGNLSLSQSNILPDILPQLKSLNHLELQVPNPQLAHLQVLLPTLEILTINRGRPIVILEEERVGKELVVAMERGWMKGLREVRMWEVGWGAETIIRAGRKRDIGVRFDGVLQL